MAEDDAQLDTDTLLVMLQSLLHGIDASQTELLEALLASDGDVEAAAAVLRREGTSSSATRSDDSKESNRKRKRATSLATWLQKPPSTPKPTSTSNSTKSRSSQPSKKAKVIDLSDSESDTTATPSKSSKQPDLSATKDVLLRPDRGSAPAPSPSKPVRLITDVLRPPEPSRPVLPKLPPLTLGTAALVAQHTPCTLHSSILPPELACRLFYRLLDEANQHWRRNKWFLGNVSFLDNSPVPLNYR